MRIISFSALAIGAYALVLSSPLYADCYRHIKVDPGCGTWQWVDGIGCQGPGNNCRIEPCSAYNSAPGTLTPVQYGYILRTQITTAAYSYLDPQTGTWIYTERSGANYTFSAAESVVIDHSDEYPHLVGVSVNLNGVTTDADGYFEVFIPAQP